MSEISLAPPVAPLLIGYLFYRKCGKCEKCRWLPRWLPCSFVLCFMVNVENVKNIGGSLAGSLAYWFSVLWEMWKMRKISVAPSAAPLLIGYLFYRKCGKYEKCRWLPRWLPCSLVLYFMGNVENVKNIGGSLNHWFSVLWKI